MTNREAITLLKEEIPSWIKWSGDADAQLTLDLKEALNMAIQALEKREPKKVGVTGYAVAKCPACGKSIFQTHSPYTCIHKGCGQALKWDE